MLANRPAGLFQELASEGLLKRLACLTAAAGQEVHAAGIANHHDLAGVEHDRPCGGDQRKRRQAHAEVAGEVKPQLTPVTVLAGLGVMRRQELGE